MVREAFQRLFAHIRAFPEFPGFQVGAGQNPFRGVWHYGRQEQGGKTLAPYGLGHPDIGGIRKHEGADFRRIQAARLEAARPVGNAHLPPGGVRAVHQQPQNAGHLVKGGRHGIRSALPCGVTCLEHKGLPGNDRPGQHQARRQRPGLP